MSSPSRILVLGAILPTRKLCSYSWEDFPSDLNISDYDVVITDLTSLKEQKGVLNKTLPEWQQFSRLLFSEGTTIFIGNPQQSMRTYQGLYLFSKQVPYFPIVTNQAGTSIQNVRPDFEKYFKQIDNWSYFFEKTSVQQMAHPLFFATQQYPNSTGVDFISVPIAESRTNNPIAIELFFQALNSYRSEIVATSGPSIWLPAPTKVTSSRGIEIILREKYGVTLEAEPPFWIVNFDSPNIKLIKLSISDLVEKISDIEKQKEVAEKNLRQESEYLKLLFEQNEPLEIVVREALKKLGAIVHEPTIPGKEDGWLLDPFDRKMILEVKSHAGPLKIDDVRQLEDWVTKFSEVDGIASKGLLVANLYCDKAPNDRLDALAADSCIKKMEQYGQCLVTTSQIYRALCDLQENKFDQKEFWDALNSTNGVSVLPIMDLNG